MYSIELPPSYCAVMIIAKKLTSNLGYTSLRKLYSWLFTLTYMAESQELQKTQIARCDFLGSWVRIGCFIVSNSEFRNLTIMFGIKGFHIDLELNFIFAPEMEMRVDKKMHYKSMIEDNIILKRGFWGWEGIGIYKETKLVDSFGYSKIEIGAHPMMGIGINNFYHESTQHAVLGCQLVNFQVDIHAAIDKSA
jgi:hypothetical protein